VFSGWRAKRHLKKTSLSEVERIKPIVEEADQACTDGWSQLRAFEDNELMPPLCTHGYMTVRRGLLEEDAVGRSGNSTLPRCLNTY
jgi:hypothetical protein